MPVIKLYHRPGAISLSVHIVLHEIGADFELVYVDLESGEQHGDAYRKINPKGRVPALVTERGILTETPAILGYLAQTFPKANLAPIDDPFAFAQVQAFNTYIATTIHVAHAHKARGTRWVDDPQALKALTAAVPEKTLATFKLIEDVLFQGPWAMGEHYTTADAYLFNVARWIEGDQIDPARLPRIIEHRERMRERPAVQKALAEAGLDQP